MKSTIVAEWKYKVAEKGKTQVKYKYAKMIKVLFVGKVSWHFLSWCSISPLQYFGFKPQSQWARLFHVTAEVRSPVLTVEHHLPPVYTSARRRCPESVWNVFNITKLRQLISRAAAEIAAVETGHSICSAPSLKLVQWRERRFRKDPGLSNETRTLCQV